MPERPESRQPRRQSSGGTIKLELSIIVPLLNEKATLVTLADRVEAVCVAADLRFEIVFVDDGSRDGSWQVLQHLAASRPAVRCIRLRRNFGKATALTAGVQHARGRRLITMDADLQDDPEEIPAFMAMLDEGYDLVTGWKRDRHDPLEKRVPSKFFNAITRKASGVSVHDFNCGYKAARREVYDSILLYGELHRYVPVLADSLGFRVGELAVRHHPRVSGESKYGFERYVRGSLDLLTVLVISRYRTRPGHLFGGVGIALGLIGTLILLYLVGVWFAGGGPIGDRPLLLFAVMFEILAAQLIGLGLISELILNRTQVRSVEPLIVEVVGDGTPSLVHALPEIGVKASGT